VSDVAIIREKLSLLLRSFEGLRLDMGVMKAVALRMNHNADTLLAELRAMRDAER
jgi:hypothetical protein